MLLVLTMGGTCLQSDRRRSAYLFYKENKECCELLLTRVAAVTVNVRGRFKKGFARMNGLRSTALQLSNNGAIQYIYKNVRVMSMGRNDLARTENDSFHQPFLSGYIGKSFCQQRRLFRHLGISQQWDE